MFALLCPLALPEFVLSEGGAILAARISLFLATIRLLHHHLLFLFLSWIIELLLLMASSVLDML